ncbi:MAG TPA: anthranilate phosphoribosyltransferase [Gemmatimonadaceae bacterium]|nr:anthranilate phosphoribosyltransferase [Gemmatimonadaceae bacterium]
MSADSALALAIKQLAQGGGLSEEEAAAAFGVIMRGEATPAQVAGLLMALRVKEGGETAQEVAGVARALREAMVLLPAERRDDLVDTCGTGGGSVLTFNISTAAALLAAGAGLRVAKHGNRSFTSRSGSADVLEALGVPLDLTVERLAEVLEKAGIVFMFAPAMHPAMRHVGPVRRELAVPTVMNVVGPLANPAGAGRQVVGVAERRRLGLLANALMALGSRRALVVYGEPGLDEVSPLGTTHVHEVRDGSVREWTIEPKALGITGGRPEDLAGGTPAENADIVTAVLAGRGNPTATAAVLLNAAAALYVADKGRDMAACLGLARAALESGQGAAALARLQKASHA